jgi:hypothetical protein
MRGTHAVNIYVDAFSEDDAKWIGDRFWELVQVELAMAPDEIEVTWDENEIAPPPPPPRPDFEDRARERGAVDERGVDARDRVEAIPAYERLFDGRLDRLYARAVGVVDALLGRRKTSTRRTGGLVHPSALVSKCNELVAQCDKAGITSHFDHLCFSGAPNARG